MFTFARVTLGALCILAVGQQRATVAHTHATPTDRSRIAFASHRDGNWEIYLMDADGGRPTRLTTNDDQERFPLWSPDATKIAFGRQHANTWELWVMGSDGSNARHLFTGIAAKGLRQWSPDGTRIAFPSRVR